METENARVIWDEEAVRDLERIHEYWAENVSKTQADRVAEEIVGVEKRISKTPEGQPLVRQLLHRSEQFRYVNTKRGYKVIFEFNGLEAVILRIFHTRQNLDEILNEWK